MTSRVQFTPAKIYDAVINGTVSLTDGELEAGIKHFGDMAALLQKSGPVFKLASVEAFRITDTLRGFQINRRTK